MAGAGCPFFNSLSFSISNSLYLWWTNVRTVGGHLSTRIQRNTIRLPRPPFPLPLGGGLAYQKFDVAHVKGPVRHLLHKPQLQENLNRPFHGADLWRVMVAII